ncbi:uncharacterized protein BP01DRAFT_359446 [Aspergillus saccharolyticus JOP 1030-1]|uniref:Zf-PARP-domain-containing protein n=1 Tax=Aspergillus saccharolyticus JOP 1030-1 TaxID=1450539 RepID=A0A318Z4X1_9EURO|nr:zf-PARP-domain-containing protein [Aspergillus saccharolyticus JOP 1030-1]PYH42355.1 zf-PARP-domain-containing protein [Aspergillus saccharolyticus JOP 1030-1]
MGAYRLDEASTGRAGCQNKECKDAKVKIAKGELRHGSWVDTGGFQSYRWRHWGCVTPVVIENLKEAIEELSGGDATDYSALDGFDELSEENQEKVRRALEQGHVDDADWRGDVEFNRPGQRGFRKKAPKETAAKAKDEEEDEEDEEQEPTPKSKKRSRAQPKKEPKAEAEADGDGEQLEEAPKAKRSKKSTQSKPVSDDEEAAKPKTSKRSRQATSKAAAEAPAATKKSAAKKPTKAAAADDGEKPKRGRKKAA